jgi:hypothetical protein
VDHVDVLCFPADDHAFARRVRGTVAGRPAFSIDEVRELLRSEYPSIELRERHPMADVIPGIDRVTWYAFREGRVLP